MDIFVWNKDIELNFRMCFHPSLRPSRNVVGKSMDINMSIKLAGKGGVRLSAGYHHASKSTVLRKSIFTGFEYGASRKNLSDNSDF